MRTFLGLLMVLRVSGDLGVAVKGFIGKSVRLPCTCVDKNLQKDIKWQKIYPAMLVVSSTKTGQYFGYNYTGRVDMTLTNRSSDCSVLLTNISLDDHGKYKCVFYQKEIYKYEHVNLHVCGTSKISQQNFTEGNGAMVFQCDIKDCYEDEEIQWTFNGTFVENSFMTISRNHSLDNLTGLYSFSTSLSTKLNLTSKPICIRKIPPGSPETYWAPPGAQIDYYRIHFKVIPVVLVLGLSLILCFLWKSHRVTAEDIEKKRQLENAYINCNELQNESAFL